MPRDGQVGDILRQLELLLTSPGSFLSLNNQLSQLQEDDRVEDVYEEGDILTAVKLRHHQSRDAVSRSGDLAVLLTRQERQPVIVEPNILQSWEWSTDQFLPSLTLFR